MEETEWFYVETGARRGPVSSEHLIKLLRTELPPDTLVWHQGLSEWVRANQCPDFAAQVPPPLPTQSRAMPASGGTIEAPTLNPFRLFRRCFSWKGRFTRSEFAVAYIGNRALWYGGALVVVLAARAAGAQDAIIGTAAGFLFLLWLPFGIAVSIGSGVRRLHDIGRPGWQIVFAFIPCVGLIMILYLLFAPSSPTAQAGDQVVPVVGVLAGALGIIIIVGIIAAIAIPNLLRARVAANESSTIGDLHSILAAQVAYAQANGGFYDSRWECLGAPAQCIPAFAGAPLLKHELLVSPRHGYSWKLYRAQSFEPGEVPQGVSSSSTNGFAVVAWPVAQNRTGVRSFCADSSGAVCSATGLPEDALVAGLAEAPWIRCVESCTALQ